MSHRARLVAATSLLAAALGVTSCHLDAGSATVTFSAAAAGPTDANGQLSFSAGAYGIVLTTAVMHVGAVYLSATTSGSSESNSSCIESGLYVGQVAGGMDVDLLSSTPQPFPVGGQGTGSLVSSAQLWLVAGDSSGDQTAASALNDPTSTLPSPGQLEVVHLAGTAYGNGATYPFTAEVSIAVANRGVATTDPSQPGLNPICKRRIITVGTNLFMVEGGEELVVRIDPRQWFNAGIDFSRLDPDPGSPGSYVIPDSDSSDTLGESAGRNLFTGILTAGPSAYQFGFVPGP